MRLEFGNRKRSRTDKDSVTSGNFTDKHVAHDIHINAPRRNVYASVGKPKTMEIWLANVKPSIAKLNQVENYLWVVDRRKAE